MRVRGVKITHQILLQITHQIMTQGLSWKVRILNTFIWAIVRLAEELGSLWRLLSLCPSALVSLLGIRPSLPVPLTPCCTVLCRISYISCLYLIPRLLERLCRSAWVFYDLDSFKKKCRSEPVRPAVWVKPFSHRVLSLCSQFQRIISGNLSTVVATLAVALHLPWWVLSYL